MIEKYQKAIILTTDFDISLPIFGVSYKFKFDDFLIDNARDVIHTAYIYGDKSIFCIAKNFRVEAQNAMLKLLEEPPEDTKIFIITNSKSGILATIRSRLPIIDIREKISPPQPLRLELNLKNIFEFIKSIDKISKDDAKEKLISIFFYYIEISDKLLLLDYFDRGYKLIELNTKPSTIISNILIEMYKERL